MAKKHWITVKRGLSEDSKHREQMGMAVWGFLHMIDRADWETGIVYDWRDKDEADDMGLNERTLRDWRQRLVDKGYISCKQNRRGLDIKIYNWINPKDYSGGIINPKGDTVMSPSENKGDTEDDTQDDTKVSRENVTPSLDSKTRTQKPKKATPRANDFPSNVLFRDVTEKYPKKANWYTVLTYIDKVSLRLGRQPTKEDLFPFYEAWCAKGWNEWSIEWLDYAVRGEMPKANTSKPASSGLSVAQGWLQRKQQEAQSVGA